MMTKRAVIVGVNKYRAGNNLRYCLNDVNMINDALCDCGYETALLTSPEIPWSSDDIATKDSILESLSVAVSKTKPGDSLLFYFSGHGSQVPDRSGDEPDGYDEVLCPSDMDFASGTYITDDDLGRIFNELPDGAALEVMLDCCHAGMGSGRSVTNKSMPPFPGHDAVVRRITDGIDVKNRVIWGACEENEISQEMFFPLLGGGHGVFTMAMLRAMAKGLGRSDTAQYVASVCEAVSPHQNPTLVVNGKKVI